MKYLAAPIAAFLLAALCAVLYVFAFLDIRQNIAIAGEAQSGAETLSIRDASARSMEILLEETALERGELRAFLIEDQDVVSAIAAVENAARAAKVKSSISGIAVVDLSLVSHEGIEVSFSASAPFSSLARFVAVLDAFPLTSRLEVARFEAAKNSWFGTFRVVFVKEKSS